MFMIEKCVISESINQDFTSSLQAEAKHPRKFWLFLQWACHQMNNITSDMYYIGPNPFFPLISKLIRQENSMYLTEIRGMGSGCGGEAFTAAQGVSAQRKETDLTQHSSSDSAHVTASSLLWQHILATLSHTCTDTNTIWSHTWHFGCSVGRDRQTLYIYI